MKKINTFLFAIIFVSNIALFSQEQTWSYDENKVPSKPVTEFQFMAYFTTQGVSNNIYAENDLLKGQTVGRLFGTNSTNTGQSAFYFEQRLIPFIIYQPKLLDGKAILRMSFEIDWTWGDASYGAGGNFGSAFSADQVNIQTQNIELELIPFKNFAINLGLQRLYDTPYNPYRTFASTMLNTGYRLAYWGSDAVGISARYDMDYDRIKAGYYQLYENNTNQNDDVALWELMYEHDITPAWRQGVSLNYVYDRGSGEGGVSVLGQGLNSSLNAYNGVYRFPLGSSTYKADIFWLGTFGSYNPEFTLGRWSINGFFNANFGKVDTAIAGGYQKACDIFGYAANFRAGYKYGQTVDDNVMIDLLYASGDSDGFKNGSYDGVLTGNMWGSPGAIYVTSGAYLLYPHGNVVNRYYAAISDLSNLGLGQFGGTVNLTKSFIPNKLKAKIGAAYAVSMVKPFGGKNDIGTELNAMVSYQPAVYMNIELHGAYLMLGDFYKSPAVNANSSTKPSNPYTLFCVFKWLLF
ncbi:MAG: hypothetical protein V1773_14920 [bacterium]